MSFGSKAKEELSLPVKTSKKCCRVMKVYGAMLFGAHIKGDEIVIKTESVEFCEDLCREFSELFKITAVVGYSKNIIKIGIKKEEYEQKACRENPFLKGVISPEKRIDFAALKKPCCNKAFIKGAFLGCGILMDPQKQYKLEFLTGHQAISNDLVEFFKMMGFNAKMSFRKSGFVVYFKESENIEDILNIMGATGAAFRLMEIKVIKDVRNNINRKVNFETANITKTVDAASLHVMAIEKIMDMAGLDFLGQKLKETALLRYENPQSSLNELCELCAGAISRSGLNHRLQKIMEIADTL